MKFKNKGKEGAENRRKLPIKEKKIKIEQHKIAKKGVNGLEEAKRRDKNKYVWEKEQIRMWKILREEKQLKREQMNFQQTMKESY